MIIGLHFHTPGGTKFSFCTAAVTLHPPPPPPNDAYDNVRHSRSPLVYRTVICTPNDTIQGDLLCGGCVSRIHRRRWYFLLRIIIGCAWYYRHNIRINIFSSSSAISFSCLILSFVLFVTVVEINIFVDWYHFLLPWCFLTHWSTLLGCFGPCNIPWISSFLIFRKCFSELECFSKKRNYTPRLYQLRVLLAYVEDMCRAP